MSHRGTGYKKSSELGKLSTSLRLDMSRVTQNFEPSLRIEPSEHQGHKSSYLPQPTSLNNSTFSVPHFSNVSRDIASSKAYADAMKALQAKIKDLESERNEAKETISRLEKRLLSGKDVWEQRLRETERCASEKEARLKEALSVIEAATRNQSKQSFEQEVIKATKSLQESIKQLSSELVQVKADCREKSARFAITQEKCSDLEVKNKGLTRVNADLQFRCNQLEDKIASKITENRSLVSISAFQDMKQKVDQLEKTNEVLSQKLEYQQELTETHKEHIQYLTEQIKDMHKIRAFEFPGPRGLSLSHSPANSSASRGRNETGIMRNRKSSFVISSSNPVSPNTSFSSLSTKKLKKEIRRYQRDRNALEVSGRRDKDSRLELQALRRLIKSKSRQLKQVSV